MPVYRSHRVRPGYNPRRRRGRRRRRGVLGRLVAARRRVAQLLRASTSAAVHLAPLVGAVNPAAGVAIASTGTIAQRVAEVI